MPSQGHANPWIRRCAGSYETIFSAGSRIYLKRTSTKR